MSLGQRTIMNALFNTMSWALPVLLSFFVLPYIVSTLGTDAYGILTLVLTVIGYFAFLDLGLGNAVVKYVAEFSAAGDLDRMNRVIGTIFVLLLILGAVGCIAILVLARPLASNFLKIPPALVEPAFTAFCIGALGFGFTVLVSFFSSIPNGFNRYDVTSIVSLFIGTATSVGMAILLYLGFGLIHIVWFNVIATAAGILVYWVVVVRMLPAVRIRPVFDVTVLKIVLRFGMYSVLGRIAYLVNYHADRIVIGVLLGVASVTYYVVPFTMVSRLTSITVRIGQVIFPAISELQGQHRYETINELYIVSSRVIFTVATAMCVPLAIFGPRLLALWMGAEFGEKAGWVMVLVSLALYISALTNVPSFVVEGLGHPKISGFASLGSASLNICMAIPLAKFFGIVGVSVAFLVSNAIAVPLFIFYVERKILKVATTETFRLAYLKPLLAGGLTFTPFLFFPQSTIANLFALLCLMGFSSLCYFAVCFLLGIFPQQVEATVCTLFRKALLRVRLRRDENTVG